MEWGVEESGYDCACPASLPCSRLVGEEDRPGAACFRNTVRKILRSDETDFSCERERQPLPKTGAWKAEIERFLAAKERKPSRERLTLSKSTVKAARDDGHRQPGSLQTTSPTNRFPKLEACNAVIKAS